MLDKIMKGVARSLADTFGDGYEIYRNDVAQGLQEPCFFIAGLPVSVEPLVGDRFRLRVPLDVRYHPARYWDNGELLDMGWQLSDLLRMITLPDGDKLPGTGLHFEMEDSVLHFFVTYTAHLTRLRAQTAMEDLDTQVGPDNT